MFSHKIAIWPLYAVVGYLILFFFAIVGLYVWNIKRRRERPPEEFKLLRGPGETLRRRVQKADEDLLQWMGAAALVPLLIGCAVFLAVAYLPTSWILAGAGLAVLAFAVSLVFAVVLLFRFLHRRRNDFLGYLGERAVAESLEPLMAQGYRVFHDVPAHGKKSGFNLDHVTVGPTGVAVVETKTRRKKKAREGYEEHVVTYDGRQLVWPWGEDAYALAQVEAEVDWLRKWIEKRTAIRVDVKPILAVPGWYVKERAMGAIRVANQKMIPSIVMKWRPQPLSPEQIDLISRQLDEICRDVED